MKISNVSYNYNFISNHLGSGTLITDINGNPYQFFLNLPFGETFVDRHSHTGEYENVYKFNGKELDTETNLYYYGARYYNPRISQFYATDPLAEKYPGINPYVYTKDNPVVLLDTDGKDDYYFDLLNQHIHIVKNGKPNRYFIARYNVEQERIKNTVFFNYNFSKWEPHSINDEAIRNLDINGKSVYEYALYHASSSEQYADIYNSYDSIDEKAIIIPIIAIATAPLLVEGTIAAASSEAIATFGKTSMEIASNTTLEGAISNTRKGLKFYGKLSTLLEASNEIKKEDYKGLLLTGITHYAFKGISKTIDKGIEAHNLSRIGEQGLKLFKDLYLKLPSAATKQIIKQARNNN